MAGVPDDRIVDEVVGRLATKFPGVNTDFLARRVWESLKSFVNPRSATSSRAGGASRHARTEGRLLLVN